MTRPHVAALFPGQGAFYQGVLKEAVRRYPQIMHTFDEIDRIANQEFGHSVSEILFGTAR